MRKYPHQARIWVVTAKELLPHLHRYGAQRSVTVRPHRREIVIPSLVPLRLVTDGYPSYSIGECSIPFLREQISGVSGL